MVEGFDEDEEALVNRLIETGLSKNTAKALVFIASNENVKSRQMEAELTLRQPEVSIAVQELREKDWVTTEKEKKEGKGRPVHIYHLAKPFREIIDEVEENEREKVKKIEENLEKIKEMAEEV